jgi:hypothetical protein
MASRNPPPYYDETMLLTLEQAFREAWTAIAKDRLRDQEKEGALRAALAEKLMSLADEGVTDPVELRKLALASLPRAPQNRV